MIKPNNGRKVMNGIKMDNNGTIKNRTTMHIIIIITIRKDMIKIIISIITTAMNMIIIMIKTNTMGTTIKIIINMQIKDIMVSIRITTTIQ